MPLKGAFKSPKRPNGEGAIVDAGTQAHIAFLHEPGRIPLPPRRRGNMSANASTSPGRAQKDIHSPGGFLFKASNSLRRSPSKKHRSQPSDHMPNLDGILSEQPKSNAPSSRPSVGRPAFNRAPSAPVTSQTLKTILNANKDEKLPHSATEATMLGTSFEIAIAEKKAQTSTLGKNTSAPPTRDDALRLASSVANVAGMPSTPSPYAGAGSSNPKVIYQHIHDMASKRISTLDYMRKA